MTISLNAATIACRKLGYTLRRTVDSEVVLYPLGTGERDPRAYYTDCPADALATCEAMVAKDRPSHRSAMAHKCAPIRGEAALTATLQEAVASGDWMTVSLAAMSLELITGGRS